MVPLVPLVDWAAWSILARPGPEDPWVKTKLSPLARYNEETFYDLPPSTCYLLGREEVASCMNVRKDPLDPPTRGEVAGVNVLPVSNKVKVSVRYDHLLHAMETSGFEFGVNCFWIMDSTDVVSDVIVHGGDPHEHWLEPKLAH